MWCYNARKLVSHLDAFINTIYKAFKSLIPFEIKNSICVGSSWSLFASTTSIFESSYAKLTNLMACGINWEKFQILRKQFEKNYNWGLDFRLTKNLWAQKRKCAALGVDWRLLISIGWRKQRKIQFLEISGVVFLPPVISPFLLRFNPLFFSILCSPCKFLNPLCSFRWIVAHLSLIIFPLSDSSCFGIWYHS